MKRTIDRAALQRDPYLAWNSFIDLLAMEEYDDLSPLQRRAHLVFWYDSEVQNGGHGQYLENRGVRKLAETVAALEGLGLPGQAVTLSRLAAILSGADQEADWSDVLDDEVIEELDDAFHQCTPTITTALEQHLERHSDEYLDTR